MKQPTLMLIIIILFPCCGKKSNVKNAQNYYKMSINCLEHVQASSHHYREALQYVNKALDLDTNPLYLAHKGTILFVLNQHNECKQCFQKALSMKTTPPYVRAEIENNFACLLAKMGNTPKALSILEKLVESKEYLTPEVALVNQAKIYHDRGDLNSSKSKLLLATHFSENYVDAHYYLGLLAYQTGDLVLAKRSLEKTLSLEPHHEGSLALTRLL